MEWDVSLEHNTIIKNNINLKIRKTLNCKSDDQVKKIVQIIFSDLFGLIP